MSPFVTIVEDDISELVIHVLMLEVLFPVLVLIRKPSKIREAESYRAEWVTDLFHALIVFLAPNKISRTLVPAKFDVAKLSVKGGIHYLCRRNNGNTAPCTERVLCYAFLRRIGI